MKKRAIIGFALAFLGWTACEKGNHPVPARLSDEPIRFGVPAMEVKSRAGGPLDEFPEGGSFGVLGYCLATRGDGSGLDPNTGPQPWDTKKTRSTPHLFDGTKVTWDGTACAYDGLQRWYEPANYLYTFLAYYPYEGGYTVTAGMGAPKVKFTMPFDSDDAAAELDSREIPDAMMAAAVDVTRTAGDVSLRFYHLLAGLNFQVNNYSGAGPVTVHSLRLSGKFYKSIEVTLEESLRFPTDETFQGTFALLSETDAAVTAAPGETVREVGGRTLLLVSNLDSSDYFGDTRLTVDYTFMGERAQKEFVRTAGFMPVGGTIYSAQLNFIGDAFVLDFVVDNDQKWESGGDSEVTFQ